VKKNDSVYGRCIEGLVGIWGDGHDFCELSILVFIMAEVGVGVKDILVVLRWWNGFWIGTTVDDTIIEGIS
jgi:hypothetical protein